MLKILTEKFRKVRGRFEEHAVWTVALPAVLAPAAALKISVLASGAFQMELAPLLGAVFGGRLVRFTVPAIHAAVWQAGVERCIVIWRKEPG